MAQTTYFITALVVLALPLAHCSTEQSLNLTTIFSRSVITRLYQASQYTLASTDRHSGEDRVNITTAATAICALSPTYVSGAFYLNPNTTLTSSMVSDFETLRTACPSTTRFDVAINLNPLPAQGHEPFSDVEALVSFMTTIDTALKLNGWWFDFWSNAFKTNGSFVAAAVEYAHSHNQTVGGNVFGGIAPTGSDVVSFVDDASDYKPEPPTSEMYGFGLDANEVASLKANVSNATAQRAVVLGHLQCNPQNGNTTESCVYMYDWNVTQRVDYLNYWVNQSTEVGFGYMWPVFYPLCPGATSFDPLGDVVNSTSTFYDVVKEMALGDASGATLRASGMANPTSASASASVTHSAAARTGSVPGGAAVIFLSSLTAVMLLLYT